MYLCSIEEWIEQEKLQLKEEQKPLWNLSKFKSFCFKQHFCFFWSQINHSAQKRNAKNQTTQNYFSFFFVKTIWYFCYLIVLTLFFFNLSTCILERIAKSWINSFDDNLISEENISLNSEADILLFYSLCIQLVIVQEWPTCAFMEK